MSFPFRFLWLFALLVLSACAGDGADASGPSQTSAPAPGVTPAPPIVSSGALSAGKLAGFPFEQVKGCDCTLRLDPAPEGSEEDLFFVFNWQAGPGVIGLNGQEYVVGRGASLGAGGNNKYTSYLHQNEAFSIQTSLTEEGKAGDEGSAYSGKVTVKNLKTGEEIAVNVTGTCSC
jgi:hypothetical protein